MSLLLRFSDAILEAGTDEAGRGCLAGPVTAAAVIWPVELKHQTLTDSKKLNVKQRNDLRVFIENEAIAYAVSHVWPEEIDKINILRASIKAMHLCLNKLKPQPEFIIIDGNKFYNYNNIPHQTIVKGDSKFISIAAASILAKTHRDEYMIKMHQTYPLYHWGSNKGYPTKAHKLALEKHGISPLHRKSFQWNKSQLKLNL